MADATDATEAMADAARGTSIMGTRVRRTEDPLFLTRGATYTDDLTDERLTGAVHATFVRSPFANASVTSVDTSAAAAAPGVVGVWTHADAGFEPMPTMPMAPPQMVRELLCEHPKYVGDLVALVLTEELYQGKDAAELIDIDYDVHAPVVEIADAAAGDALVFPAAGTNLAAEFGEPRPDDFFDGCEVVVTERVVNQRVAPVPLEVRAAAAVWGDDGRVTLWCTNQGAQGVKAEIAGMLGYDDPDVVHIITPDVGGGFGAKISADTEAALVVWAAKQVGRPVRWIEDRSDNLVGMTHGRGQDQVLTIGGSRDGTVTAYSIEIDGDAGAYPRIGTIMPTLTMLMAPGVYAFPKIHSQARTWVTNTTSKNPYRGAGRPEATAAVERAIDLFAAEIGMDPAEVRRKNLLPTFDETHVSLGGAAYDVGDYEGALDRVLAAADYDGLRAEQQRRREAGDVVQLGIGVSVYVEITGADTGGGCGEVAELEVHPDGTATVLTGTSPHGQGHATAWAMLAHMETGIPIEQITVVHGDTDRIPVGIGTFGSRSLQQGGAAVQQAAAEVVDLARQRAADLLEANPEDIEIDKATASVRVKGAPGATVSLARLAEQERLHVATRFDADGPTFPFGAHIAVTEVDTETGLALLRRLIAVDDAGTILNPLLAEGQVHGGLAQGVSQALFEEMVYDADGQPLTATLATYAFPSATEFPSFELVEMATPTWQNPLGAKGIGESGTVGSTPAVQSSVIDAVAHLGVRHIDMPLTPQRVYQAIQDAKGGSNR